MQPYKHSSSHLSKDRGLVKKSFVQNGIVLSDEQWEKTYRSYLARKLPDDHDTLMNRTYYTPMKDDFHDEILRISHRDYEPHEYDWMACDWKEPSDDVEEEEEGMV